MGLLCQRADSPGDLGRPKLHGVEFRQRSGSTLGNGRPLPVGLGRSPALGESARSKRWSPERPNMFLGNAMRVGGPAFALAAGGG
jgi:hypothetical protein